MVVKKRCISTWDALEKERPVLLYHLLYSSIRVFFAFHQYMYLIRASIVLKKAKIALRFIRYNSHLKFRWAPFVQHYTTAVSQSSISASEMLFRFIQLLPLTISTVLVQVIAACPFPRNEYKAFSRHSFFFITQWSYAFTWRSRAPNTWTFSALSLAKSISFNVQVPMLTFTYAVTYALVPLKRGGEDIGCDVTNDSNTSETGLILSLRYASSLSSLAVCAV